MLWFHIRISISLLTVTSTPNRGCPNGNSCGPSQSPSRITDTRWYSVLVHPCVHLISVVPFTFPLPLALPPPVSTVFRVQLLFLHICSSLYPSILACSKYLAIFNASLTCFMHMHAVTLDFVSFFPILEHLCWCSTHWYECCICVWMLNCNDSCSLIFFHMML